MRVRSASSSSRARWWRITASPPTGRCTAASSRTKNISGGSGRSDLVDLGEIRAPRREQRPRVLLGLQQGGHEKWLHLPNERRRRLVGEEAQGLRGQDVLVVGER